MDENTVEYKATVHTGTMFGFPYVTVPDNVKVQPGDRVRVTLTKIEPEPRCFHCSGKLEQNGASVTENWHECTRCFMSGPVFHTAEESLQWWRDQLAKK